MKHIKTALCALALMAGLNGMAQNEISFGDKLIIRDYEIVDEDGKVEYNTNIKVAKKDYTIRRRMRTHYPSFYMGYSRLSNNTLPTFAPDYAAGIGQKQSKCWDWGIYTDGNSIPFNKRGTIGISYAFGIGRSSYKFTGGNYFYNDNGITRYGTMPGDEKAYDETWFRYWGFRMPINLELQQYINKKALFLTFGPEIELRFSPKSLGRINGYKKKSSITHDFDLNPFNVNLMAQVGYDDVGFMAKLSLIDLFQNPMRPESLIGGSGMSTLNCEVYPLTIGFSIFY